MLKYFSMLLSIFLFCGCLNIPDTGEIENDIDSLNKDIKEAANTIEDYSGGLLRLLAKVRLETLQSTKAMLEQKKQGLSRYIKFSYSIQGEQYSPPENKNNLLEELEMDIDKLENDLEKAEYESKQYSGGLLWLMSLTEAATIKNSIVFLDQRRLLLKHDIPYYEIIPDASNSDEPGFTGTPGEGLEKF